MLFPGILYSQIETQHVQAGGQIVDVWDAAVLPILDGVLVDAGTVSKVEHADLLEVHFLEKAADEGVSTFGDG
jgi:hypothetical protein